MHKSHALRKVHVSTDQDSGQTVANVLIVLQHPAGVAAVLVYHVRYLQETFTGARTPVLTTLSLSYALVVCLYLWEY